VVEAIERFFLRRASLGRRRVGGCVAGHAIAGRSVATCLDSARSAGPDRVRRRWRFAVLAGGFVAIVDRFATVGCDELLEASGLHQVDGVEDRLSRSAAGSLEVDDGEAERPLEHAPADVDVLDPPRGWPVPGG